MKAPDFRYARPGSLAEAYALLAEHGDAAVPLAGGQSLMPALNMRLSAPELVVDIGALTALRGIALDGNAVRIGALARHAEVLRSPIVAEHLPLIAEAMPHVGHVAIRNRGTFGGSIAHADPAAELPACTVALGARIVLGSAAGTREIAAADFYTGLFETARRTDELVLEIRIPSRPEGEVCAFLELSRRHGDYALAGVAAVARFEDGRMRDGRFVYFGCTDRPKPAERVLRATLDGPPDPDALSTAVAEDVDPADSPGLRAATKAHLAAVLTRRALSVLQQRRAT